MSSKLSRVSISASGLFDPTVSGTPQPAPFVQVLARIGTLIDLQTQPASAMWRGRFSTPKHQECNRWPRPR